MSLHRVANITQLFHTSVPGGPSGISFQVGPTTLFTSPDDERLYVLDDPAAVLVLGPVPPGMAAFLIDTWIEPRLAALAGR